MTLQLMPSQTELSSLMKQEEETHRQRRREGCECEVKGGEEECVCMGVGGAACINIACAEPAEDAYPSVGAAVMYQ